MRFGPDCLTELIDVAQGRVSDGLTGHAGKTLKRAGQRLRWREQIVVTLVGSTGFGESSLTNALVGSDVTEAGVLRPTTTETLAVSFGDTDIGLLDWLRVRRRQEMPAGQDDFGRLMLLDLPGHGSMVSSHRVEVDRIVPVVDQFIWVLDPQKYAGAAIHHGYLRPLSRRDEVMAIVLNQVNRIRAADLDDYLAHLGQLPDSDGLAGVPLFATSITTGVGVGALREHLTDVVAEKRTARTRLSMDLGQLAGQFEVVCRVGPEEPDEEGVEVLEAGSTGVAGVPRVTEMATEAIWYHGMLATGWPIARWMHRLRPDPLKRLRTGLPGPRTVGGGFVPDYRLVAMAQLRITLRQFPDTVGNNLGED